MIDNQSPEEERQLRNRMRIGLFLGVAVLGTLASAVYSYARPAVYESRLRVMISAPINGVGVARDVAEMTARQIEAQRELLTTGPVLARTLKALAEAGASRDLDRDEAAALLAEVRVEALGQSDILELSIEGGDPSLPPVVLNTWISAYTDHLAETQQAEAGDQQTGIDEQLELFEKQLLDKRVALERFRADHDILSSERSENEILARLNGLNASLSLATEDESRAAAGAYAIQEALAAGEPVVRREDSRVVADLERRANDMRENLKALDLKFTAEYIAMDSDAQILVRQLQATEARLAEVRAETEAAAAAEAERDHRQAIETRRRLESEIAAGRTRAAEFSNRFAEQQALQLDLEQLETSYRGLLDRSVAARVDRERDFVEIRVLEKAVVPSAPVRPLYVRDAMIGTGASFLAALVVVLLFELIIRPIRRHSTIVPVPVPYPLSGPLSGQQVGEARELIEGRAGWATLSDQRPNENRDEPEEGAANEDAIEDADDESDDEPDSEPGDDDRT